MPILDKNNESMVKKYNEFVRNREHTSALQDLNWAYVKKEEWTHEAVYLEKNGNITATMSMLIRTFAKGFSMIYVPRGPVCSAYDISTIKELVDEAKQVAKKYNAFVLKFDPEALYDEKLEALYKKAGFRVRNKDKNKHEFIQPIQNMILRIKDKTEEEIFKGYSEKTRYNIRVAEKKGVTVRFSRDEEDLKKFYELSEITAKRDGISLRNYDYYKRMLDAFDENHLRIYIAEHEGQALSGAIALNYGGKLFYIYGASSNEKRNLMPNYLMQQTMIRWAIETGCNEYDFGGIFEINKANGLYRFKEGFCRQEGVTKFIGEIDYVYNKLVYFAFVKLLPIYKKFRKFFKRK